MVQHAERVFSVAGHLAEQMGLLATPSAVVHAAAGPSSSAAAAVPSATTTRVLEEWVQALGAAPHFVMRQVMVLQASFDTPLWGLGLVLMILGTICSSVGMIFFKKAGSLPDVPWYRNGWFWGGVTLFCVTAAGLDVVVFAITPLALIAPFAGFTIVVTFLLSAFGCCGVKEAPSRTTGAAVLTIVAGVTLSCIFGPHSQGTITPRELQGIFDRNPWMLVFSMLGAPGFIVFALTATYLYQTRIRALLRTWGGALTLALVSALFGALTQLQFKALASVLMSLITHKAQGPQDGYTGADQVALQVLSLISSGVAQMGFLNYAISVAPVAYSVPSYQSGLLITTLILAGWVLNEYSTMKWYNVTLFWIGCAVVACGMLLNAWGLARAAGAKARQEEKLTEDASACGYAAAEAGGVATMRKT